ncbi:hypothetical protein JCM10908_000024 [Rhodotorula pacifica]|uniref:zinc finger MYND domain-containing protein n=1 Tax=Rhodotorula pacifica TaxID=1495444 RepID=UPI00316C3434
MVVLFCSTEHQQLFWPYHRLVCGERAHPFLLPPFSQKEARELVSRLAEQPKTPQETSLRKELLQVLKVSESELALIENRITALVGVTSKVALPTVGPSQRAPTDKVRALRLLAAKYRTISAPAQQLTTPPAFMKPHEAFLTYYDLLTHDIRDWFPPESLMHSYFCHRFLAHSFLVDLADRMSAEPEIQSVVRQWQVDNLETIKLFVEISQDPKGKFAHVFASLVRNVDRIMADIR